MVKDGQLAIDILKYFTAVVITIGVTSIVVFGLASRQSEAAKALRNRDIVAGEMTAPIYARFSGMRGDAALRVHQMHLSVIASHIGHREPSILAFRPRV
jgi:hypothetical protein